MLNPALKVIDYMGGRSSVASAFGISREAVRLWVKNGIPADRALAIEEATRGRVKARDVLVFARKRPA